MPKKKPLPPSTSEMLPVGTLVKITRPNMWAYLVGNVETFGNGAHLVRVKYPEKEETFLIAAQFSELQVLSETKELSK